MAAMASSAMAAISTSHSNPLLKTLALKSPPPLLRSHQTLAPISLSLPSRPTTLPLVKPASAAAAAGELAAVGIPTLKSHLAAGETLYGLFLLSFSPTLAEIAGLAGYDYVVVDMEHGPGGISAALPCLRALAAASTPAILRLPDSTAANAKKALDLGPAGIMFPAIDSPSAAELAVSYSRFPPRGVRGSAHPLVRASAYGLDDSYVSRIDDDILIICQVESAAALECVDAIAAVDGVDVVQMGPLDLSASMGYLWDPGNRKVRAVMRDAEAKVLDAKAAYLGGFAMPHDSPEQLKFRGYHMVAGAADIGMFRKAAAEDVRRFRNAVAEVGEEGGADDEDGNGKDNGYWSE